MNVTYAISLWNFSHYAGPGDLEGELAAVRAQGYGIELWPHWPGEPDLYSPAMRDRLVSALAGMPVSLHSALVRGFAAQAAQVDAAAELGANVLVTHSDEFFQEGTRRLDAPLCRDVVAYAAERGVRVALENGQLPFLAAAIGAVEGLHVCLDVGHVYLTDALLCDFLDALGPRIIHLHLQDMGLPGEAEMPHALRDHYTPGTGSIPAGDWHLLARTLRALDFRGMAVFEVRPRNPYHTARLGRQFFQEVLASA